MLVRVGGLPVHEATLFLNRFRMRGCAANTLHGVCTTLAFFYRWLEDMEIDLLARLEEGKFLTDPELYRLADITQYRAEDLPDDKDRKSSKTQVISLNRVGVNGKRKQDVRQSVVVGSQATRLRYIKSYLAFLAGYIAATLTATKSAKLEVEAKRGVATLSAQIPWKSNRATLGSRVGVTKEQQDRLLAVVNPNSPANPWVRDFVRQRNWLIILLLLASGIRRGELLNLQISDLMQCEPRFNVLRRPDSAADHRVLQPTPKTRERTIELLPAVMRQVWRYVSLRHKIKAARQHPFLIVSEDGDALSYKTIDKIFADVRRAWPDLNTGLSSHVMRHTWNERFSEQAEEMEIDATAEERARVEQQGWKDNSKTSQVYTRRYAARKGREISRKLQEKLDVPDQ